MSGQALGKLDKKEKKQHLFSCMYSCACVSTVCDFKNAEVKECPALCAYVIYLFIGLLHWATC